MATEEDESENLKDSHRESVASWREEVADLRQRVRQLESSATEIKSQLSSLLRRRQRTAQRALFIRLALLVLLIVAYLIMRKSSLG